MTELDRISEEWVARAKACESGLDSWFCPAEWLRFPGVAEVLKDYTFYGDKLINSYLRQGSLPDDIIYDWTFKFRAENHTNQRPDSVFLHQLRQRIIAGDPAVKDILPGGYNHLLQKYSDEKLQDAIRRVDHYFARGAKRLQEPVVVFRNVDVPRQGKLRGYLSTTFSMKMYQSGFGPLARFGQVNAEKRQQIREQILAVLQQQPKAVDDPALTCCLMVLRVAPHTPFINMEPFSQTVGEYEILLPQGMYIELRNMCICEFKEQPLLIWFADAHWANAPE